MQCLYIAENMTKCPPTGGRSVSGGSTVVFYDFSRQRG